MRLSVLDATQPAAQWWRDAQPFESRRMDPIQDDAFQELGAWLGNVTLRFSCMGLPADIFQLHVTGAMWLVCAAHCPRKTRMMHTFNIHVKYDIVYDDSFPHFHATIFITMHNEHVCQNAFSAKSFWNQS